MNFIYVSSYQTKKRDEEIKKVSKVNVFNFQAQKFHNLLVEGIVKNGHHVDCLSTCSIIGKLMSVKKIKQSSTIVEENISFYTLKTYFYPIIQQTYSIISTYRFLNAWYKKNEKGILICDTLEAFYSLGAIIFCKLHRKKMIAIVTDLPSESLGRGKKNIIKNMMVKLYGVLFDSLISFYDGHVLLTKQMNEVVNKKSKPYVVIEGLVDVSQPDISHCDKSRKKIILFAGSIEERFGINILLEAFHQINNNNIELHIYGYGKDIDIFKKFKNDYRIKYFGIVPNEKVVLEEINSWLLINPRLTNENYAKYSFPSKNMEYMASGTALLTTKLPGMPKEYYDYIYLLEVENSLYLKQKLEELLSLDDAEIINKGRRAREFVMTKKNNIVQAKKVIELCEKIC